MRINHPNRNWATIRGGLPVATIAMIILAAGTLRAERASGAKEAGAQEAGDSRPVSKPEPTYVPGEIIVKLTDGQPGAPGLLSLPGVAQREGALMRLQAVYGLSDETPLFKGVRAWSNRQETMDEGRHRSGSSSVIPRPSSSRLYLFKTDRDVPSVCRELRDDPDVEYAQPNYIYERCANPNDPEFADQYAHQLIQMSDAWDISTGSRDIVVAVLDTGVDVNHPDLKDNIWINEDEIPNNDIDDDNNGFVDDVSGWNFQDDSNDVIPEFGWSGYEGHGTMVAGVIAGVGNNGIGVSGVNWTSSIMALRLSISMTTAEVAAGLDYATANGAHVINMSFGGADTGPEGDQAVKAAIDNAYAQGILLVASAGNADTSEPLYPAAYYNVMAVSSTNGEDIKTGHSSFGHWVDIAAPGTDIVTTDLDNEYIATAGTSFSGPYVAAVGALLLAHDPNLTHVETRAILENTTDPVYYGDVNPDQGYVGTGRVNAYSALLESGRRHPLGEIVEPMAQQIFASDGNDIPITAFVHGDSYELAYSGYEMDDWTLLSDGSDPIDPNGFVHLSLANPGVGVFDLRLTVTTDGYTHTDRKLFGIEYGVEQEPWPMPEMPEDLMELPDEMYTGSPFCLDIDGDGRNEIVQASMTWTDFWPEDTITIWEEDGTPLEGWPRSLGSLAASGMAVGDIDGDGDYEIVVVDDWSVMATALHAETGEVVEGDWPIDVGDFWYAYIVGSPILADLDGDGDSEIIIGHDAESADTDGLFAIQGDGTFLWQRRYTTEGPMSVADFDGDGNVEIALCGYGPGITRVYTFILDNNGQQIKRWRGGSKRGTAIGDLDGDGEQELVFCTEDSVTAVHIDGKTVWTARVRNPDPFDGDGGLSIGDIDSDGFSEVYVSSHVEADGFAFTLVHAFDHEGNELSDAGFPKTVMGDPHNCSPLIGDIDGDGDRELLIASAGTGVIAWEADGSTTPGFPMLDLSTDFGCTPAIEDLDRDGDLEMIVNGYDYQFHVIDLPGKHDPGALDWTMARRDPQNSGWAAPAPSLNPIEVPVEIEPGQRLEFQLTTTNPTDRPIQLTVGNLPEGAHYDPNTQTVIWKPTADQAPDIHTFSFLVTDGIRQHSQSASIAVLQSAIYWADMNTDPNWLLDEGWAWGAPAGAGSWNGDPNSAYTGENVIGYELEGDYDDNMAETRYATTGAINCQGYRNVRLSFRRWLGVESPYDHADIQVSNDGINWIDLWTTGYSHVSDNAWQNVDYAVPSSVADDQPTVFFRWGIGPTDESVTYPGWNIDNVQVTGDPI
jgi:subtilisin family serine protease